MIVPTTGGWQSWQTIGRSGIPLTAGLHVLRVVIDTNGSTGWLGNLNSLRLTVPAAAPPASTPFGGTAAPIPGLIEAEDFDDGGQGIAYRDLTAGNSGGQYRQTDVDIATTPDNGGGYILGYVAAGEWLKYTVSVAATGSYTLEARVASAGPGGAFHVEVDGTDVTGPIVVATTGGWQSFQTITRGAIPLTAGPHVLQIVIDTNGSTGWWGNLNYLRWVSLNSPAASGGPPASVSGAAVVVEEIPARVVEVPRRFVVNRDLIERGPFYECAVISRRSASCGDRQKSIVETRWTQPTVQYGAQGFAVENSRRISSVV
jgi:hypothetical protein